VRESHVSVVLGEAQRQISLVRSPRRHRSISISVRAGTITVRAPMRTSQQSVLRAVAAHEAWILRRLATPEPAATPMLIRDGARLPYLGTELEVRLVIGSGARTRVAREGDRLTITAPASRIGDQQALQTEAVRWYRAEAMRVLGEAVVRVGRESRQPKAVLIRDQKRRWGSCSSDGTIRFNWRLVMLEPALVEYVVAHELAHLSHQHHQPPFWAEVARLIPDHKDRGRRLQLAGRTLRL
jgi:predicted metal-dependent hydrolase